jgi:hypothetical protein
MAGAPRLLTVLAALASPLAFAASGGAGALRVTATPERLRLAEGGRATLKVPCAHEPPALGASAGRIELLQEISPGVYQAEYVPPESLDPQVAIVAARCAEAFGWVPIVLDGVRDVAVAARHGTPVSLEVEDERFGPVPASATGRAVVRVVVPPGTRFASYRGQRIELDVTPRPVVHLVLDRSALDANASGVVEVRAVSVDERGAPIPRAQLALSASEGVLSAPAELEPGVARAQWRLTPGKVREATVTARLAGRPAPVATAVLERVAGRPRRITLDVSRDAMIAGEGDELSVTALVVDAGGNPTDSPATLAASPGTVVEWDRVGTGRHVGRVQVPRNRSGRRELELEVVAAGALSATRAVALLPGPARQVRVDSRDELYADGRTREIRVTVLDANDNRVDVPALPSVGAARGEVGTPARYGPGAYRVDYRAPLRAEDFTDEISVSLGPLRGAAPLRVRALGGGVALAPKLGFTLGQGGLGALAGGGDLGLWLPFHGVGLVLEARAFGFERTDTVRSIEVRTEASFVALEASLAWRRPLWGGMTWLAAGGGGVSSAARVSAPGQPDLFERRWAPAAHGSVGWGWPVGPGIPFGEVTLGWQGDPGRGPLRGSLRSLTFSAGYRLDVL